MFQVRNIKRVKNDYNVEFSHLGMMTLCQIMYGPKGNHPRDINRPRAAGVAVLNPADNYNKDTGRKIALQRALVKAGFNKENRKLFWQKYFEVQNANKPTICKCCGQAVKKD